MLHIILFLLYGSVVVLALIVARRNWQRPITLALTAIPALAAIYARSTRLYRLATGELDAASVYDQVGTVAYWLALMAILGYAFFMTRRISDGRGFVGPDGRRWGIRKARVPGDGEVSIARPAGKRRTPPLIE